MLFAHQLRREVRKRVTNLVQNVQHSDAAITAVTTHLEKLQP